MRRPQHNTTSLPRQLREELGLKDSYGEKKRKRSVPSSQKERHQPQKRRGPVSKNRGDFDSDDDDDDDDDGAGYGLNEDEDEDDEQSSTKQKKSNTKTSKRAKQEDSEDDGDDDALQQPTSHRVSNTVKDKLAQDDKEIAALEKKLGLKKGKKLPKSFAEEGLDELLGDMDEGSGDERRMRKSEADEWLQKKRRKAQGLQSDGSEGEDGGGDSDESEEDGLDGLDGSDGDDDSQGDEEDGDFDGLDEAKQKQPPKKRENPYVAPVPNTDAQRPNKYIPPSLRARSGPETESLTRLRRQAQGQLNKLSESNLVSILAEIEKLYRDYPRQNVTSTLISLLLGLICERSALQDTFIILHAGFIAAIYKVVGMDFGAELVQNIVERLDSGEDERGKFEGKERINLVSLLSQLYNFHVIGSALAFDYIRIFLQDITEANTELLLKVIKSTPFPSSPPAIQH